MPFGFCEVVKRRSIYHCKKPTILRTNFSELKWAKCLNPFEIYKGAKFVPKRRIYYSVGRLILVSTKTTDKPNEVPKLGGIV